MDILIITVLIIAAVILFLVEVFFIPGISIAGIGALAALAYANYYAFVHMGPVAGFTTLIISGLACIGSLFLFMRSKTLDKVSLKQNIDSKVDKQAEHSLKVGDRGIATTRLALIGHAEINDKIVEVRSTGGFIDEKTPVIVTRITDRNVLVEEDK